MKNKLWLCLFLLCLSYAYAQTTNSKYRKSPLEKLFEKKTNPGKELKKEAKKEKKAVEAAKENAEKAIISYLKEKFGDAHYKGYDFGTLYKDSPEEIIALEEARANKLKSQQLSPDSVSYFDSLVLVYKKEIQAKKLYSTYEMAHFFVVDGPKERLTFFHSVFTLYPDGKVKDVSTVLQYELTDEEYDSYFYYYKQYPFVANNTPENAAFNSNMYTYLSSLYTNEQVSKEEAFRTLLVDVHVLKENLYFDSVAISQILAITYLSKNYPLLDYTNPTFTELSNITDSSDSTNASIGYSLMVQVGAKEERKAFYVEYDINYIIRAVLVIEPPFEEYFQKEKE